MERREILREVTFAASVLQQEAHALALMAAGLNSVFSDAVSCLYDIPGRIAVTGMGKSGHVARKVAATLASTGSPAYFIHPGEAMPLLAASARMPDVLMLMTGKGFGVAGILLQLLHSLSWG